MCALVSMFAFTGMTKALEVQDGNALKKCLSDGEKCVLTANIFIMDDDYNYDYVCLYNYLGLFQYLANMYKYHS